MVERGGVVEREEGVVERGGSSGERMLWRACCGGRVVTIIHYTLQSIVHSLLFG